jgi:DNA repair exonuclease SbcCD ATPase subunit
LSIREQSPERYKRRFLVVFTPSESDRLDRLGLAHGSKRRAILAGLRLLESGELETLRERVAALEGERDAAAAAAAAATEQVAKAGTLRKELQTATRQLREVRAALTSAQGELRQTRQDLAKAQHDGEAAQAEARRQAALVPHFAACAACGKYVPESEWAEQPDGKGGVHVYHKPHGLRLKPTLGQNSSALFWRATPAEPAK